MQKSWIKKDPTFLDIFNQREKLILDNTFTIIRMPNAECRMSNAERRTPNAELEQNSQADFKMDFIYNFALSHNVFT